MNLQRTVGPCGDEPDEVVEAPWRDRADGVTDGELVAMRREFPDQLFQEFRSCARGVHAHQARVHALRPCMVGQAAGEVDDVGAGLTLRHKGVVDSHQNVDVGEAGLPGDVDLLGCLDEGTQADGEVEGDDLLRAADVVVGRQGRVAENGHAADTGAGEFAGNGDAVGFAQVCSRHFLAVALKREVVDGDVLRPVGFLQLWSEPVVGTGVGCERGHDPISQVLFRRYLQQEANAVKDVRLR